MVNTADATAMSASGGQHTTRDYGRFGESNSVRTQVSWQFQLFPRRAFYPIYELKGRAR